MLSAWQKEYGLPEPPGGFKTTAELFAKWDGEDARMTDAEREEERRAWELRESERDDRPLRI